MSKEIYRGDDIQIQLVEHRDSTGEVLGKGFDHPWEVDLQTLEDLLGSIQYRRGVLLHRNKLRDAFPPEMRNRLLMHLKRAFALAGSNQAVDFSFVHRDTTLMVFQREYLTDGLLFRKGGTFNCALRNLDFESLGEPEAGGMPGTDDPTSRPLRTDWRFVLKEGQKLASSDASGLFGMEEFPNWIQVDLSRNWVPERARGVEEAAVSAGSQAGPSVEPAQVGGESLPVSQAEIEERLRFLDELHREGTLPDATYERKKRELLERSEELRQQANP